MTETSVYTWLQTVCNSDSLLSSVFTKLLYVVFLGVGTMSEPASRRWNYLWFPLLLSIKCEVETRIRARDCNTSLPPIYEQLLQLFIRSRIDCVSPAVQSKLLQYRHLVPMLKQYPILQPLSNSVEKLFSPWLLLQSRFRHEWSMYQYHHPIRRVVPMRELNTLCKSLLEWEMNNDDIVTMAREDPDIHELLLEFCGSAHSHTCELQDEIASSCRTCLLYNKLSCMEPRTLRIEVSIQNSRTCIGTAFGDELNSSLRIGRDGSSRTEGGVQYSLSTQDWPALRGSGGHAPEVCLTREGLIGDLASLRWLRLDEYSTRSSRYTPIVLSVDSDGLMQYVGSVVHHDVDGERISHDLLILDHDMKPDSLQVEGRDEDIDPEVYVLTIRTVPGHYIPPVYWVSKTHCLNCNQFHGDDYDQTRQYSIEGYDENGNEILTYPECRKPHLVEDGKIYSAVTLEELCISDGKFASGVSRVLSWYVPVLGPWAAPCSIG
ncbi:hypothetical protein NEOLEDRAFT_65015 [Neolentinus lepideus HHB14362 ss-1]|uniref:Uncharacterized protein n=1 Tax=Neolentinus lepideus HHB14362 ss-1 TaxID=1314782 RepID=A0A165U9T9_9AGAM|nr:hypothetical protein NEOLEDRAFT_65015 [Neolentinus lepideus HHB14362 ss-1]